MPKYKLYNLVRKSSHTLKLRTLLSQRKERRSRLGTIALSLSRFLNRTVCTTNLQKKIIVTLNCLYREFVHMNGLNAIKCGAIFRLYCLLCFVADDTSELIPFYKLLLIKVPLQFDYKKMFVCVFFIF